ncbi:sugar ABC transporter substrate-binding protein [Mesorhizobium sp. B2-1-3A]|uniref:ABC transporter substrate-binding protein n=1 Tax=Mesorhizobium sp. B2-1-3A TaxID=2589971 RepID=UPI00112B76D9|nr:sugar ABC transporter substrate-binding protein [Mesorhizobium sp. B2-1-3A]TPM94877.1 sugar ABC transporter substrate-binding protein [Mesorhizobium sp. B2-1-3A]
MFSSLIRRGLSRSRATVAAALVATSALSLASAPANAEMNWKAADGQTINLMLISHPFVESLKPLLPEFTAKTGIKVTYEELAEQSGFEKLLADLSSKTGTYDVFMTSPLNNWQYAAAGWLEPLDGLIANTDKTAADYDVNDFIPSILSAGRWDLTPLKGIGEGSLWTLPINFESYQLAYRPSLLKKLGLQVPKTYADLLAMSDKLAIDGPNGKMHGIITRFDRYWDLPYLTFGTMLQSYGVEMLDKDGKLQICSDKSIAATQDFVTLIKKASPEGAGAFTWYEAMQGFASGQYVFSLNEANLFAPTYEDPKQSAIAGDVGYAPTPLGPDGKRAAAAWIWSLSMNSASTHKDAAWLFMQWVTSKETMIKTHLAGNMNPVRKSAWDAPEVAKLMESWGETPGQYIQAAKTEAEVATIRFPPHPELTRMLDRWAEAIQKSYFGQGDVKTNLCNAQADIQKMLDE